MARYKNGVLGQFTGTVGTVVGSKWNGISYMRSRSGKKSGLPSPLQLEQQAKFKTMVQFLMPVKELLMSSCYDASQNKTGYNIALGYNLKRAIGGSYPNFTVSYADVKLSLGWVGVLYQVQATVAASGLLQLSWSANGTQLNAKGTDEVVITVICPALQEGMYKAAAAVRSSGTASIDVSAFKGHQVLVYVSCLNDAGFFSDSVYAGTYSIN